MTRCFYGSSGNRSLGRAYKQALPRLLGESARSAGLTASYPRIYCWPSRSWRSGGTLACGEVDRNSRTWLINSRPAWAPLRGSSA
jgi:hypothetical protein